MTAIIRTLTIILLMSNAAAGFLGAAGAADVWGVEAETGIEREAKNTTESAESVGSGPVGLIDALGGATIAAVDMLTQIDDLIFAAPTLALNMGIPKFIVDFAFAPMYVAAAIDMASVLRGIDIR